MVVLLCKHWCWHLCLLASEHPATFTLGSLAVQAETPHAMLLSDCMGHCVWAITAAGRLSEP